MQRAADAAIVEGEDRESALGEVSRELRVVGLRHAGRRHDERRALRRPVDRGTEAVAVPGGKPYLHEFQRSEAPPAMIRPSMKRTCRWACMRLTSHAATALPGIVATPTITPAITVSSDRSEKRWKSTAFEMSSTMLIRASVASTACPDMPVPRSSETMITPTPLATPCARPNTLEPTARPRLPRAIAWRFRYRRTGTETITMMPSIVPMARASSAL